MIHPTAVIDPKAEVASGVSIGAYAVIGPRVTIDSGCEIGHHAVIQGPTRIGKKNRIFHFTSVGEIPQDKKYAGEDTILEIGDGNVIREFCTLNRGTVQGGGVTRIGDSNWIMAYVHIAHDCIVGNDTIFANNASLAGHVIIEDHAILGGFSLVHQFCRIGAYSFLGKAAGVLKDVPPFVIVSGYTAKPYGLNIEGLKRHSFSKEKVQLLKKAYRILYRSNNSLSDALQQMKEISADDENVDRMITFLQNSTRGIVR